MSLAQQMLSVLDDATLARLVREEADEATARRLVLAGLDAAPPKDIAEAFAKPKRAPRPKQFAVVGPGESKLKPAVPVKKLGRRAGDEELLDRVLAHVKRDGVNSAQVAKATGLMRWKANRALNDLTRQKRVVKSGRGPGLKFKPPGADTEGS